MESTIRWFILVTKFDIFITSSNIDRFAQFFHHQHTQKQRRRNREATGALAPTMLKPRGRRLSFRPRNNLVSFHSHAYCVCILITACLKLSAFSKHACSESCTQRDNNGCAYDALSMRSEAFSRRCRKISCNVKWRQQYSEKRTSKLRIIVSNKCVC